MFPSLHLCLWKRREVVEEKRLDETVAFVPIPQLVTPPPIASQVTNKSRCYPPPGNVKPPWRWHAPLPRRCTAMVAAKYLGLFGQISSYVFRTEWMNLCCCDQISCELAVIVISGYCQQIVRVILTDDFARNRKKNPLFKLGKIFLNCNLQPPPSWQELLLSSLWKTHASSSVRFDVLNEVLSKRAIILKWTGNIEDRVPDGIICRVNIRRRHDWDPHSAGFCCETEMPVSGLECHPRKFEIYEIPTNHELCSDRGTWTRRFLT